MREFVNSLRFRVSRLTDALETESCLSGQRRPIESVPKNCPQRKYLASAAGGSCAFAANLASSNMELTAESLLIKEVLVAIKPDNRSS
jgi:hypothetical protein